MDFQLNIFSDRTVSFAFLVNQIVSNADSLSRLLSMFPDHKSQGMWPSLHEVLEY